MSHDLEVASVGYTSGMKTAISLPDELFEAMERHAELHHLTRSGLVQIAVREYLEKRQPGELTRQVNEVLATLTEAERDEDRALARAASAKALRRAEW